ncbi:MAG: glycosyltransferase [Lachnospiraceae bacterium]|nr:glycosyltransferase [Lachnospiraceae bacterium]
MKQVVHLITGLAKGGAETMLYQVLKYRQNQEFNYRIISLGGGRYYEELIRELGYEVIELDFRRHPLSGFFRLCRELRGAHTLCCWMYHANLVGYLAAHRAGVDRVVWCIRHSDLSPAHNKARTLRINQICARLSKNVSAILYNGNRARTVHEAAGYCHEKGVIADNGCDCEEYRADGAAAQSLREELNIPAEKQVILSVTKDTPIKDIPTFIKAFGMLHRQNGGLVAVLCGAGVDADNARISALSLEAGLEIGKDIFLLGIRHDVSRLLAACDLYVLHSAGEAFPNALLQAMACGCVCVTTDVGDAKRILNSDVCVVPPGEPEALAKKITELLELPQETVDAIGCRNRARVQENFDIREIVKQYEKVF